MVTPNPPRAAAPPVDRAAPVRGFARVEEEALEWLAAADPRLAARTNVVAPDVVLKKIGMDAVLAEDATAQIRGDSLDLFAFRARAKAIDEAAKVVGGFVEALPPNAAGVEGPLARPSLERELLVRLIDEEKQRVEDESALGAASGDLVRGILSTWTQPASPQEWPDRDAWVSRHLLEIRDSLRSGHERALDGPLDLDTALYPLERLLAPLEFPRGAAAIAEVRVAMDQDLRAVPLLVTPDRIAREAKAHLGVDPDLARLPSTIALVEQRLLRDAERAVAASAIPRSTIEARARDLLFVEGSCGAVAGSRVRALRPPPERAAICGALGALGVETEAAPAIVALHDDVLLALAAIVAAPPPRTLLLSRPHDDRVDDIRRAARERPIAALGVVLAAQLIYGAGDAAVRIRAWRALGDAPLDVVARELAVSDR